MATPKKISALDLTPTLPNNGEFPVSIDGVTYKGTIEQLITLAGGLQSLVYNPATGQLTISGGNTVTIPIGARKWVSEVTAIGGGTPVTFTHGLDTEDVLVEVWDDDTKRKILGPVETDGPNAIIITASVTFNVRVVVIG